MDAAFKKRALHRAKILKGQFEGYIKAIEADEYCTTLLEQSLSMQQSLKSMDAAILENHLTTHVVEQMQTPAGAKKAIKELTRVFSLSKK
jgi:DNA-binding FrmR family transcriptional regulator